MTEPDFEDDDIINYDDLPEPVRYVTVRLKLPEDAYVYLVNRSVRLGCGQDAALATILCEARDADTEG